MRVSRKLKPLMDKARASGAKFMSFEDAMEMVYKAACMVRAAGARENGVFDDPELQKLGPLDIGSGADILRIMGPATRMYHDLCTALDVVKDYMVDYCEDNSDLTDWVDECPRGRKYIDENDPICGACEFYNVCELPMCPNKENNGGKDLDVDRKTEHSPGVYPES